MGATSETAPPHLAFMCDITRPDASDCAAAAGVRGRVDAISSGGSSSSTHVDAELKAKSKAEQAGTPPTYCSASTRGSEAVRGRSYRWAAVTDIHLSLSGGGRVKGVGGVISCSYGSLWRRGGACNGWRAEAVMTR